MRPETLFYDFVNSDGVNVIREWIASREASERAKITVKLRHIEASQNWQREDVDSLSGAECSGLTEVRVKPGKPSVQMRPLFFYGPNRGQACLLLGATKKVAAGPIRTHALSPRKI
jgi:hypothetical protein